MAAGEINIEIERMILAAPDETEPYLVYADWLQERGDPLGDFIALQYQMTGDPLTRADYAERLGHFINEHAEYLLGALHTHWQPTSSQVYPSERGAILSLPVIGEALRRVTLHFHLGFVRRAVLETYNTDVLRQLMKLPTFRFLDYAACRPRAGGLARLVDDLSPTQRSCLRVLFLSHGDIDEDDARAIQRLNVHNLSFYGTWNVSDDLLRLVFPHPTIEALAIHRCAGTTAAGLADIISPKLRELSLDTSPAAIDPQTYEVVGTARALRHLSLEPCTDLDQPGRDALSGLQLDHLHLRDLPALNEHLVHWLGGFECTNLYADFVEGAPISSERTYVLNAEVPRAIVAALCEVQSLPGFRIPFDSLVTMEDLEHILSARPRGLYFEDSGLASAETLARLRGNSSLESLWIHGAPMLTTRDFDVLRTLPALRSLSLLDIPALTGEVLDAIVDQPLRRLQLPPLTLGDAEWDALLSHTELTELDVPATGLTAGRLLTLLQKNPRLCSLTIRGPARLSADALLRLRTPHMVTVRSLDFRMPHEVGLSLGAARITLAAYDPERARFTLSSTFSDLEPIAPAAHAETGDGSPT